ncbi:zf-HC2 domain-containing protein, partial [bacterium]|nr:zf-HC2 domain-containing protein [bacterium]
MPSAPTSLHITQDEADEYALGVLDADDNARIAMHAAGCPACQALIDSAMELTGQLALTAPQYSPPPALKAAVLRDSGITRAPPWRRIARYARPAAVAAAIASGLSAPSVSVERSAR